MIKVAVADYGLYMWYGDIYDYEERLLSLKKLGYDGLERLYAKTEAEAVNTSALARKLGMDFATCEGASPSQSLHWSAALCKKYVWAESTSTDFEVFCRQVNSQIESARRYGVIVGLHNHLGSAVETQEQIVNYMNRCPKSGLILDVAHLAGAGGDPLEIIDAYPGKLVMVHLKDYVYLNRNAEKWYERIRFCELGAGEMADTNRRIVEKLREKGYGGWIAVEQDTHLRDPMLDLKESRELLKEYGI